MKGGRRGGGGGGESTLSFRHLGMKKLCSKIHQKNLRVPEPKDLMVSEYKPQLVCSIYFIVSSHDILLIVSTP